MSNAHVLFFLCQLMMCSVSETQLRCVVFSLSSRLFSFLSADWSICSNTEAVCSPAQSACRSQRDRSRVCRPPTLTTHMTVRFFILLTPCGFSNAHTVFKVLDKARRHLPRPLLTSDLMLLCAPYTIQLPEHVVAGDI